MSYIGQNLPSNSFIGYTTDTFAGDGSTTAFTMSKAPFNESAVIVVINNVVQQPTADFTISGTTLTIDAAVASGDVIYATHTGGALPIGEASSLASNIAITTTGAANFNGGVTMGGTTPTLTIGDAGAEDTKVVFDGNAQDFYIGLDDSADDLIIGLGSAVGTTPIISVDENKLTTVANGLTLTDGDVTVASGHGINFAATGDGSGTDSSELLDDYEEGTWVPVFSDGSNDFTMTGSYNSAAYTRIGRVVYVNAYIGAAAQGSANNGSQLQVKGLPYNVANSNIATAAMATGEYYSLGLGSGTDTPALYALKNSSTLRGIILGNGSTSQSVNLTCAEMSGNGYIMFGGFYLAEV